MTFGERRVPGIPDDSVFLVLQNIEYGMDIYQRKKRNGNVAFRIKGIETIESDFYFQLNEW